MSDFPVYTLDSAPPQSRPLLERSRAALGMIPNLHGVMAQSPQLLEAYQQLHSLFLKTSLTAEEQTVVWQSVNREHNCHYCLPAHTAVARMMNVSASVIEALNAGAPLPTPKLEALRNFTLQTVRQRGVVADHQLAAFREAGYTSAQVMEVLLGVTQKIMSNYLNHMADTPVDEPFRKFITPSEEPKK
ncbi:carboxymuconolactone decarboxylase family protein [bacterium]|nr:carboxymuconolactone decarboxylase family protein [bacterium]